ncbi:phage tail protein, partial [Pantoea coffeiphila]|uniref:phage tail protein n=1 Tax=Pantoea coffeiphila TaxID=1465635 RepID=UPI0015595426
MPQFMAVLTETGKQRFASAAISGQSVGFLTMAVGDGGGTVPAPENMTGLINERFRAALNRVVIADQSANVIRAEMIIQPQAGGFWIREAALYGDDGACLAVASVPPSYKPLLAEGSGRLQAVNLWIAVSSTADVKLMTDPSVILATLSELNRARDDAKDYADEVAGELDASLKTLISEAVSEA